MKKHQFIILVLAVIFASTAIVGKAQTCPPLSAGCLDTTFGSGGTIITTINGFNSVHGLTKTVIQSDGKILDLRDVHGEGISGITNVLTRYNADGSIDSGFGSGGVVYMNWNLPNNAFGNAYDIALQTVGSEEKIIVAGSYGGTSSLRVDRYNADGSADTPFGSGGTAFFNTGYALAVAVQPDGKIVTVGDTGYLVRLTANGTLDTSFGSGGVIKTTLSTGWQLAIQSNGRILVGNSERNITVVRFNANGSLDDGKVKDSTPGDSFGSGGKIGIEFFPRGYSGSVKRNAGLQVDANDKIVIAGQAWRSSNSVTDKDFAVARLTTNGKLDTTFDGDGKATFNLNGSELLRSSALQADGRILLTGIENAATGSPTQNMALVRLNPNGSLDSSFGTGGVQINDISSEPEGNYFGAVQFDPNCLCEKIVVTGQVQFGGVYYAFAARYLE